MNFINNILSIIPDKLYITLRYRRKMGKWINWKSPKDFNEKLQYLKLYDRKDFYTKLVDKASVKEYVSQMIGDKYIIPTLGVYNNFDEINFNKLPNQFVIKTTHDSGGIVICKNKSEFDKLAARKKINSSLKNKYYLQGREWPYKNVVPRVIVEKYIEDEENKELRDYKFFIFNGKAKFMFIATDRFNKDKETCFDFFDMDFNKLNIQNGHPNSNISFKKPNEFNEMRELAEKIGKKMKQVRVDFYLANNNIYFGEITLFHHSGFVKFYPETYERMFGDMIDLSI